MATNSSVESIVQFFEKFVTDFSVRRFGMLFLTLFLLFVFLWTFEGVTGHFRSKRMEFSVEQLKRISDPELGKQIKGDSELEKTHSNMKVSLSNFVDDTQIDLRMPDPVKKLMASALPWTIFCIIMINFTDSLDRKTIIGGTFVISFPFVIFGAILPTYSNSLINYVLYPFGSMFIALAIMYLFQKWKSPQ